MKSAGFIHELFKADFLREQLNDAEHFDLALHCGEPASDRQNEKELRLVEYERLKVRRDRVAWNVFKTRVLNANLLEFFMDGGEAGATVTHVSLGIGGQIRRLIKFASPVEIPAGTRSRLVFKPGNLGVAEKPGVPDEPMPKASAKATAYSNAITATIKASASVRSGGSRDTAKASLRSD